jgi:hypothetical protein
MSWNRARRIILNISLLVFVSIFPTSIVSAGQLKPISGEFTVVMSGVDPATGELLLEGWKTGELPGYLTIRAALTKQTGLAIHIASRWTLTTSSGDTVQGENTAIVNPVSLHFREHGVIVDATGSQAERVGNFVVINGTVSDVYFIPGMTTATARVVYVPSQEAQ